MKICILEFYKRLSDKIPQYSKVLQAVQWFIIFTFIGVVLSTLLECRPFNKLVREDDPFDLDVLTRVQVTVSNHEPTH